LWHADERGEYDNGGFRYRGHLFTDAQGRYHFRTILPALYPGRTRHYHVKVQAPEQSTTPHQYLGVCVKTPAAVTHEQSAGVECA
jgi:protocatechuate 3,4-dioxygenase beta subunit